ncbi:MAG: helix-turn-helix transcriptional regulator [Limnohabitans sp.]
MKEVVKHLTQRDLAERWQKSESTIERYRCDGTGPLYLKIGGKVLYRLSDIENFEGRHIHAPPLKLIEQEPQKLKTLAEALKDLESVPTLRGRRNSV